MASLCALPICSLASRGVSGMIGGVVVAVLWFCLAVFLFFLPQMNELERGSFGGLVGTGSSSSVEVVSLGFRDGLFEVAAGCVPRGSPGSRQRDGPWFAGECGIAVGAGGGGGGAQALPQVSRSG